MNILIFAGYYLPHTGGYIKNIHELSKRLVARRHSVTVATSMNGKDEVRDGVEVIKLPTWNILGGTYPVPKPSVKLWKLLLGNQKYDVVVTQTRFFLTSVLGVAYAKWHKIPHIHVERGSCHSVVTNKVVGLCARLFDHTLGAMVVRAAQRNVGVSQAACNFITHLGGIWSALWSRVIHNGVLPGGYIAQPHMDPDHLRIIFVGRLIHAKGVQDLIWAFENCCEWVDGLRLVIVGDGNYRGALEKQAKESKYEEQISFRGDQQHKEVMMALAASDVFVNPSYSEGLPTSVVEAASVGLPIVATDVGGTNEIIKQGKTGVLVKAGNVDQLTDAITVLVTEKERAQEMGRKARESVVNRFDWNRITDQWEVLLEEITSEPLQRETVPITTKEFNLMEAASD